MNYLSDKYGKTPLEKLNNVYKMLKENPYSEESQEFLDDFDKAYHTIRNKRLQSNC